MEKETVIKVENLHKKFTQSIKRTMAYGSLDIARSMVGISYDTGKLRKGEFWALEDINFDLKKGDALGIIGVNGSGKSTLLRLLTGIFPPDKGRIEIKGRVGSLIAVGAGFHPHMTGRENIFLNGVILGMSKKEIESKFESIITFADIGNFIDAPVSTYSSGMRVRLGFAIAIHSEPDILLIDEILSVGDLSFRNKSLRHMAEFRKKANALIFVSHDMEQIRNLCNRVIVLDKGKVIFDGESLKGVIEFEEMSRDIRLQNMKKEATTSGIDYTTHFDSEDIIINEYGLIDDNDHRVYEVDLEGGLKLFIEFEVRRTIESLTVNVPIVKDDNTDVYIINIFSDTKIQLENLKPGKYKIELKIKKHNLSPGTYMFATFTFRNNKTMETYKKSRTRLEFKVKSDGETLEKGLINVNHSWNILKIN